MFAVRAARAFTGRSDDAARATEIVRARADGLAAVTMEGVTMRGTIAADPAFVRTLRAVTREVGSPHSLCSHRRRSNASTGSGPCCVPNYRMPATTPASRRGSLGRRLHLALLNRGIFARSSTGFFLSTAMREVEIERTVAAVRAALSECLV